MCWKRTWDVEENMQKKCPRLFESEENADQGTKFSSDEFLRLCVSMLLLAFFG